MDRLKHHGIKGQKWGVRRFQNKDGSLTREGQKHYSNESIKKLINKKDKTYNLEKWGSSPSNNLLIIAGVSGSGKSTTAKNIKAAKNAIRIELDLYYENPAKDYNHDKSRAFNKYLKEKVPNYAKIQKNFEKYDEVRDALFSFSKEQYGKNKVIAEGVQWLDSTMYPDINKRRSILQNNPSIIKQTSVVKSTLNGILRDDISFLDIPTIAGRFKFNKNWNKNIKDLTFDV